MNNQEPETGSWLLKLLRQGQAISFGNVPSGGQLSGKSIESFEREHHGLVCAPIEQNDQSYL